ncbi:MAG: InlB B-repeat-containing protein [Clostridia bacterium]|nr:InlB B-repeat-containing protein [Clostridia bacterium]
MQKSSKLWSIVCSVAIVLMCVAMCAVAPVKTHTTDSTISMDNWMNYASGILSGSGTVNDPYLVGSATDLATMADMVQSGYANAHYQQTKDISLRGKNWTPITFDNSYTGFVYDGNDKTISDMTISVALATVQSNTNFGMFAENYGTVQNLTLFSPNVIVEYDENIVDVYVGAVAGINYGTIEKVTLTDNGPNNIQGIHAGGIAGFNAVSGLISQCNSNIAHVKGEIAGGIVASNNGRVEYCKVSNFSYVYGEIYAGGIAGQHSATDVSDDQIYQCAVYNYNTTGLMTISGGGTSSVGGIVGENYSGSVIDRCMVYRVNVGTEITFGTGGTIWDIGIGDDGYADASGYYCGGIAGTNSGVIKNVYAQANDYEKTSVVGSQAGGLIGRNANTGTLENSWAVQRVFGVDDTSMVGNIIGKNEATSTDNISNVYYSTDVSAYEFDIGNSGYRAGIGAVGEGEDAGITGKISADLVYKENQMIMDTSEGAWVGKKVQNTRGAYIYPSLNFDKFSYADYGQDITDGLLPLPIEHIYTTQFELGTQESDIDELELIQIVGGVDLSAYNYTNVISHYIVMPTDIILNKMGGNANKVGEIVWTYTANGNTMIYDDSGKFVSTEYKAYYKSRTLSIEYYFRMDSESEYSLVTGKIEQLRKGYIYRAGGTDLDREYTLGTEMALPMLNYKPTDPVGYAVIWRLNIEESNTIFENDVAINGKEIYGLSTDLFTESDTIKAYGTLSFAKYKIKLMATGYLDTGVRVDNIAAGNGINVGGTAYTELDLDTSVEYGQDFDLSQKDAKDITVNDLTKDGVVYAFKGWRLAGNNQKVLTAPSGVGLDKWAFGKGYANSSGQTDDRIVFDTINGEVVVYLYAVYTTKTKTVQFYGAETQTGNDTYTKLSGQDQNVDFNTKLVALPSNDSVNIKPTGMKVGYWFYYEVDEDGQFVLDENKQKIKVKFDITKPIMRDLKLYAWYMYQEYKLNFDKNNADAEYTFDVNVDAEYTSVISLKLDELYHKYLESEDGYTDWLPTMVGYVCNGWYLDAECTQPIIVIQSNGMVELNETQTMPENELTLYAGWRAKEFYLSLKANGGADGNINSVLIKYGENIIDKLNGLAKSDLPTHKSKGLVAWSFQQNAGYTDGLMGTDKYILASGNDVMIDGTLKVIGHKMIDVGPEGTLIPVYAVWRTHCKVTFDAGGGEFGNVSWDTDNSDIYLWGWEKVKDGKENFNLTSYTPKLEGYKFLGWYIADENNEISASSLKFTEDMDIGGRENLRICAKWDIDPDYEYSAPSGTQSVVVTLICLGAVIIALVLSVVLHAKGRDGYVSQKEYQRVQTARERRNYNPHDKDAVEQRDKEIKEKHKND